MTEPIQRKRNPEKSKAKTPAKKTSRKIPPGIPDKPKHPGGRPRKVSSPAVMQRAFDKYFKRQDKEKRPYTVVGIAIAVGLTRKGLCEYNAYPEFSATLMHAKARIEEQRSESLVEAGSQVNGIKFDLENNFGWSTKQDVLKVETNITVNERDLNDRIDDLNDNSEDN